MGRAQGRLLSSISESRSIDHERQEEAQREIISEAGAEGWTLGQRGKGNIDGIGAYHWNIDEDGSPHHADRAHDGEVPCRRFDIEPDGTIYPVVDGINQRWDSSDWSESLASHSEFKSGEEIATGFGHAQGLLDKLSAD